jgi:hypothetical protein
MVNLFSIRCSLSFAPYLVETLGDFKAGGAIRAGVVRQGGSGLIIRAEQDLVLRHQNRESRVGREEAAHYLATVLFRVEFYDVKRMTDEVVLANVGHELLLSHPQSELWLRAVTVASLVDRFNSGDDKDEGQFNQPGWLTASLGAGRLMLSDQRNGRWVLLGGDHLRELERRLTALRIASGVVSQPTTPTIFMKGIDVHLQSAFKLADTLEAFAETGQFTAFEEVTANFVLRVKDATEGIEISDSDTRLALTRKEAGKWAIIIRAELNRLNAECLERGRIRTVFTDGDQGTWVLQWGDEVFLPNQMLSRIAEEQIERAASQNHSLAIKRTPEFLILLAPISGDCVAIDRRELEALSSRI